MKKKYIFLVLCVLLLLKWTVNCLILVPSVVNYIVGVAKDDVALTEATVLNKDLDDNITVSYKTENDEEIITTYHVGNSLSLKQGENVHLSYCRSNPSIVYSISIKMFLYLIGISILYFVIYHSPFFYDLFAKRRAKTWQKEEYDFVDFTQISGLWWEVSYSREQNGKQLVEKMLCPMGELKILIDNGILKKVPIIVNPKKPYKKYLDYSAIEEKVVIHKTLF